METEETPSNRDRIEAPHTGSRSDNFHVDAELHQEIDRFFDEEREFASKGVDAERVSPAFEGRTLQEHYYITASVSFSGGWFLGDYSEREFGVAVSLDGGGGFFQSDTEGFGFGLPVGVAVNFGATQATSDSDLAGPSGNLEVEIGKLGLFGSVSPGEGAQEYEYSAGLSLGVGPNMPFSISNTTVETFHDLHERLKEAFERFSGNQNDARLRYW